MAKQYLSFIMTDLSSIGLDKDAFQNFKNKVNRRIIRSLKEGKNSVKIEKEIFRKIIKYNYTNDFDLVDLVKTYAKYSLIIQFCAKF